MLFDKYVSTEVLNLIITGIPSIHRWWAVHKTKVRGFKPYYNWNTFNTSNGIRSIRN